MAPSLLDIAKAVVEMAPSSLAAALAASKTAPTKQKQPSLAQFAKSKNDTQQPDPDQHDGGRVTNTNTTRAKSSGLQRNARNVGREKSGGKDAVAPTEKGEPTPGQANQANRPKQKHKSRRNRNRKGKAKSPKREANDGDKSAEEIVFLCDLPSDDSSDASGASLEQSNSKQTPRQQKRGARTDGKGKGQRTGRDRCCPNPIEGHDRHERRRGGQFDRGGQDTQRRDNRNRKGCDSGNANAAPTPTRATPHRTPRSNKAKSGSHGHFRASESPGGGRFENIPSPRRDANASLSLPQRNEELDNVQVPAKLEATTIKGRWADEDSSDDD